MKRGQYHNILSSFFLSIKRCYHYLFSYYEIVLNKCSGYQKSPNYDITLFGWNTYPKDKRMESQKVIIIPALKAGVSPYNFFDNCFVYLLHRYHIMIGVESMKIEIKFSFMVMLIILVYIIRFI